ncbi:hypothetical protein EDB80DRAFT_621855, partial [Ilyonectria destructans]
MANVPTPSPPALNHFSCANCRRRKVKCNKTSPCTNCVRGRLTCVFPQPRRPVRTDTNLESTLIARVQNLEEIINSLQLAMVEKDAQISRQKQQLQEQLQEKQEQHQSQQPQLQQQVLQNNAQEKHDDASRGHHSQSPARSESIQVVADRPPTQVDRFSLSPHSTSGSQSTPESDSGKLIRDEGRSIYINGTWAAIRAQVGDFGELGDEVLEDEEAAAEPSAVSSPFFDFPFSLAQGVGAPEHPCVEHRQTLWRLYIEVMDPMVKVLHLPTVEPELRKWLPQDNIDKMPRGLSAVIFAVYFSVVSSMEKDQCQEILGRDRDELVLKYKAATERVLTMAGLLNTDNLLVLQAFLIYLVTLRHHAPRLSWTLCSLAFRLIQAMGAHRDGASLSVSKFETEMRKRLFWNLSVLECGASEDCGCDPTQLEISSFNTSVPLNLNDEDLTESMVTEPEEHTNWTQSTPLILWADICQLWRLLYDSRRRPEGIDKSLQAMTVDEKRKFIGETVKKMDKKFVKICSPLIPVQWVTATLARLLVLEYKVAAYMPLEQGTELSQIGHDELFANAIECLELSNRLLADYRGVRWGWLFKTFTAWYPLAFVLTKLNSEPLRRDYERCWRIVERVMVSRWHSPHEKLGHQWRSMMKLFEVAQASKARSIRRRRESFRSRSDLPIAVSQASKDRPLLTLAEPCKRPLDDPAPTFTETRVTASHPTARE